VRNDDAAASSSRDDNCNKSMRQSRITPVTSANRTYEVRSGAKVWDIGITQSGFADR
jgi:hypothetical protein